MYHFRSMKYCRNLSFPQAKRVGNLTSKIPLSDSGQAGMTAALKLTSKN